MSETLQQQLNACLVCSQKWRLVAGFPPELESRFEADTRRARYREVSLTGIVALLAFDLFLISDYTTNPASIWWCVLLRLGLVTPCGVASMALSRRWPALREPLLMLVLALVGFCVLAVSLDHSASAAVIAQGGLLVTIFSASLVVRSRFFYAGAANLIFLLEEGVFLHFDRWLHGGEKLTYLFLVVSCIVLSLLANYRLERGERTSYLLLLREEMQARNLVRLNEDLERRSNYDALTGLANRLYAQEQFTRMAKQAARHASPIAVILADLDHFKRLNDSYGHLYGDQALVYTAQLLQAEIRGGEDLVARFGGEEFLILLPQMDEAGALRVAERLRLQLRREALEAPGGVAALTLTMSCGVASAAPEEAKSLHMLIAEADRALYQAKRLGRDQVCGHTAVAESRNGWILNPAESEESRTTAAAYNGCDGTQ